jgi:hypothetical protein
MFYFFKRVYNFIVQEQLSWGSVNDNSYNDVNEIYSPTLQKRMQHLTTPSRFHPYKGHIISLKSKELLEYINKPNVEFNTKFSNFNQILNNVSKSLYLRYSPNMIYSFNDEINLVFFHNENDTEYIYGDDINKTITSMTSYASIQFMKEFTSNKLDIEFVINGKYVEFDEDYEMLNYIIWRQNDCYRNNLSVLHNNYNKGSIHSMSIVDVILSLEQLEKEKQEADGIKRINFGMEMAFFYGNIIKKEIVYKEINGKMVCKKELNIDNETILKWNFDENVQKYIYNKLL